MDFISSESITKPPILPPLKNTSEPTGFYHLILNIRLLFELDIAVVVNPNPAIAIVPITFKVPPIVVLPLNKALEPVISPLCLTLKLELDININRG